MTFVIILALGYAAIGILVYVYQRNLQYFPARERVSPEQAGLEGVQEEVLTADDGTRLIAWYSPAPKDAQTIIFFQGNAGAIWGRSDRFEVYRRLGFGVLFPSYRGYGGSGGSPTEQAIVSDGLLAVDWLEKQGVYSDKIVLIGESLGSGVAIQVAAKRKVAAVILEAPFSSAVDIGASAYWWLPVRLLMKDKFLSTDYVANIGAPLAVIHGDKDRTVPISSGRKLFDAAVEPKKFITVPGAGHVDLSEPEIYGLEARIIREATQSAK